MKKDFKLLGSRAPRVDANDKVTGRAIYADDMKRPGMLHGALVQSPLAHARILSIDTSKAAALPGVRAVLTGAVICVEPHTYQASLGHRHYRKLAQYEELGIKVVEQTKSPP